MKRMRNTVKKAARTLILGITIMTIAISLCATPLLAAQAADGSGAKRPDINYDWNDPCCDGGRCCIDNDCSCPMCWGRGEPDGTCPDCGSDLCPECGNCPECGTSPCPECRTEDDPRTCDLCGGELCSSCWGCLECGDGRNPKCPYCGAGEPLFSIGDLDVYLFAPADMPSWAVFNVLAAMCALAMLAWAAARAVLQKKREDEEDKHSYALREIEAADNASLISTVEGKERYNMHRRLWALAAAFACAISGIVLILATQDFKGTTAIFDRWSVLHGVLLAGTAALSIITFRNMEDMQFDYKPDNS